MNTFAIRIDKGNFVIYSGVTCIYMHTPLHFRSTTSCSVTLVSWLVWIVQQFQGLLAIPL